MSDQQRTSDDDIETGPRKASMAKADTANGEGDPDLDAPAADETADSDGG